MKTDIIIYQNKTGEIEFKGDFKNETIWASLQNIADLFDTDKSGISRHISNIYESNELNKKSTVAKIATVQKEGEREVQREIEYYNLDLIISVGYRVNSKKATIFRQWATKTLRNHLVSGYTINKKRIAKNYDVFIKAVEDIKALLPIETEVKTSDAIDLIKIFATTWLSLGAYDSSDFPKSGVTKIQTRITSHDLTKVISNLRDELILKQEASELFGIERSKDSISGIIGNVFQAFDQKDVYPSIEEKAAYLLYFIVKNHPFADGNKRSGAFAFIWFLQRAKILNVSKLSPEALTALTLLVAKSNPKDKNKMIGLILMLLK